MQGLTGIEPVFHGAADFDLELIEAIPGRWRSLPLFTLPGKHW